MKVQFFDRQELENPLNGSWLRSPTEVRRLLEQMRDRKPFFAELIGDNGFTLMLAIGASHGAVQFGAADGLPPYLMAVACDVPGGAPRRQSLALAANRDEDLEFLIGGTPTPVSRRYCLPYDTMVEVAARFVDSGDRYAGVAWEEI